MEKNFNPLDAMWTEKYRPKKISDMVGTFKEEILEKLKEPQTMQHLLLYSKSPGTGKTTLAKAIIAELGADYIVINSSDDRKIETVRDKVKAFANTQSTKPGIRRVIFLDEADGMTKQAQEALRNMMETFASNALFILTCNDIGKIHEAIQSRCSKITFAYPEKNDIAIYLTKICVAEGLAHTKEGVDKIIELHYPSIRDCVTVLQDLYSMNKPIVPDNVQPHSPIFDVMWKELIENKNWKKVKEYIYQTTVDPRQLNKFFWEKAVETENVKLIQRTCLNEVHMSYGSDPKVILTTSLIEMVK